MADPRVIRRVRAEAPPVAPLLEAPAGARQIALCQHCRRPLTTEINGKVKLAVKSRVIAFVDGVAELKCPHCGHDTPLPEIRLVVPQGT